MKLTALFLTCICFVTSVGSCYYGPGIQAVSAQEVQTEDAQDSTLTVDDEAVDEDAQNLSAGGGTGISEDSTESELADGSAVTDYLFFDKDGKQIGEPQDSEPTDGSPEGCVGYVKRTTAGTSVTVEPYAMTGYEFAMLDLLSKEENQTSVDKYTPLSRNYVKDGTSNKEITTTDTPLSYTFTLNETADYANGTSYKVIPDLEVYFDKEGGKLNEILIGKEYDSEEISPTPQPSDKPAIKGWLAGKIPAGTANPWGGSDVKINNSNIIFDAGENKAFEISEVVAYGRFGWQERFRFSVALSNDKTNYNDVLTQTSSNGKLNYTPRKCSALTEVKTGRYLRLKAMTSNADISYMSIYGNVVSTCEQLKTVKELLEEYKTTYESNNSLGYSTETWNEFKSKYDEAQNKVTAHEEENGCNTSNDNELAQAGDALKTAYQNLIESKSTITYQFFKDGICKKTESTLYASWENTYDGYVKVTESEDGKSAVLTPVAASEHEFSLITLEAYENGNLVRSFSPISNYYRYKENPTSSGDTELVKDNNYEVKLTLSAEDGGAKSIMDP